MVALFSLTACNLGLGGLFVDKIDVHNGLVDSMDAVLVAEEAYWDAYIDLAEGDDGSVLDAAYTEFATKVTELDEYYTDTTFHSSQQTFIDLYYKDYKPFTDDYVEKAGSFVEDVNSNGYDYNVMYYYFEELDQFSYDYVEVHNALIDIVNYQADE